MLGLLLFSLASSATILNQFFSTRVNTDLITLDADSAVDTTIQIIDTHLTLNGLHNPIVLSLQPKRTSSLFSITNSTMGFSTLTISPPLNAYTCEVVNGQIEFTHLKFIGLHITHELYHICGGKISFNGVSFPNVQTAHNLIHSESVGTTFVAKELTMQNILLTGHDSFIDGSVSSVSNSRFVNITHVGHSLQSLRQEIPTSSAVTNSLFDSVDSPFHDIIVPGYAARAFVGRNSSYTNIHILPTRRSSNSATVTHSQETFDQVKNAETLFRNIASELLEFINCTLINFSSNQMGGAIYQDLQNLDAVLKILSTNFTNCLSSLAGGAIYAICSSFELKDSLFNRTITQHLHDYASLAYAGACCLIGTGDELSTITNTHFLKCASDVAGALMLWTSSSIDLAGCLFEQCAATRNGAGVFLASIPMLENSFLTNVSTCLTGYLSDHNEQYMDAAMNCLASSPLVAHCTEYLSTNSGDYLGALLTYVLSPELSSLVAKVIKSQKGTALGDYVDAVVKSLINDTMYQSLTSFLRNHPEEYVLGLMNTVLSDDMMKLVTPLMDFDLEEFTKQMYNSVFNATFMNKFNSYLQGTANTTMDHVLAIVSYFVNDDIAKALKTYLSGNPYDILGAFQTVLKDKYPDIASLFDFSSLFGMVKDMFSDLASTISSVWDELPISDWISSLFGSKDEDATVTALTNQVTDKLNHTLFSSSLSDEKWFTNFTSIIDAIGSTEAKQIVEYIKKEDWEGLTKSFFSPQITAILTSAIDYLLTERSQTDTQTPAADSNELPAEVKAALEMIKPISEYVFKSNVNKWIYDNLIPNINDPEKLFSSFMQFFSTPEMAKLMDNTLAQIKLMYGSVEKYIEDNYMKYLPKEDMLEGLISFAGELLRNLTLSSDFMYLMSEDGKDDLVNTLSYFIRYDSFQSFLSEYIQPLLQSVVSALMKNSTFAKESGLSSYLAEHAEDYAGAVKQCFDNVDIGDIIEQLLDAEYLNNFIHFALPYYVSDSVKAHLPKTVEPFNKYLQAMIEGYFEGSTLADIIDTMKLVLDGSEESEQLIELMSAFLLNKYGQALIPFQSPDVPKFLSLILGTSTYNTFKKDHDVEDMELDDVIPELIDFYGSDLLQIISEMVFSLLSSTASARQNDLSSILTLLKQLYDDIIKDTKQTDLNMLSTLVPLLFNKNVSGLYTAACLLDTQSDPLYILSTILFEKDFVKPFFDYGKKEDIEDYIMACMSMFLEKDSLSLLTDLFAGKFATFAKQFAKLYLAEDAQSIYNKYLSKFPGSYLLALASPVLSSGLQRELEKYSNNPQGFIGAIVSYTFSNEEIIAALKEGVTSELTAYLKEFKCDSPSSSSAVRSNSLFSYNKNDGTTPSSPISVSMSNCAFMDNTVDGQWVKSGVDFYIPSQTTSSSSSPSTADQTESPQPVSINLKMNECYTTAQSSQSFTDTGKSTSSSSTTSIRTSNNPAQSAGSVTPTETSPRTYSPDDPDGGLAGGAIAAIVIVVILVVGAVCGVIAFFAIRSLRQKDDSSDDTNNTNQTDDPSSKQQPSDIPMTEQTAPSQQEMSPSTQPPALPSHAPPAAPIRPPPALPTNRPPPLPQNRPPPL